MKNLPVIYSQRDQRWTNQRLGTVDNTTIGSDGCFVTSFSILACYYGHTITPNQLDDLFTNNGWYINGNLLTDNDLQKAYSDCIYQTTDNYQTIPADLEKLKSYMQDETLMVVLEIDMGGGNTHFVVCVDCDGSTVTIANPWSGAIENFTQDYGDPVKNILKFVVYKGKTSQQNSQPQNTPSQSTTEQQQPQVVDDPMVSDPKSVRDELVAKASNYDSFANAGYHTVDQVKEQIAQVEADKMDAYKKIGDLTMIIGATKAGLGITEPSDLDFSKPDDIKNLFVNTALDLRKNIKDDEDHITELEKEITDATASIQEPTSTQDTTQQDSNQSTTEQQQPIHIDVPSNSAYPEIGNWIANQLKVFLSKLNGKDPAFANYKGLGKDDLNRIYRGVIYALLGAALTYWQQYFLNSNFGIYAPLAVTVNYSIVSTLHKLLDGVKQ